MFANFAVAATRGLLIIKYQNIYSNRYLFPRLLIRIPRVRILDFAVLHRVRI